MKHFDLHICVMLEDPSLGMRTVEEQNELINSFSVQLLHWFDDDENYAWDMMLKVCKYAVNIMDIIYEYYCIGEILYHCSQSKLSWTTLFCNYSL